MEYIQKLKKITAWKISVDTFHDLPFDVQYNELTNMFEIPPNEILENTTKAYCPNGAYLVKDTNVYFLFEIEFNQRWVPV